MLSGYKTYAAAAAAILLGIVQFLAGDIDAFGLLTYLTVGGGAAAIRAGIEATHLKQAAKLEAVMAELGKLTARIGAK